jgi:hypothetical protein
MKKKYTLNNSDIQSVTSFLNMTWISKTTSCGIFSDLRGEVPVHFDDVGGIIYSTNIIKMNSYLSPQTIPPSSSK